MTFISTEIIKQQDALKDLPDEQVKAFETLANNLFKKEIDDTTGVWHRRLEEDVKTLYGLEKPQGMKSYEFLKHAKSEFDKKIENEKKNLAGKGGDTEALEKKYKAEIERLQADLKDAGLKGSELLKQDIEGYKKRIGDYEALIDQLKEKSTKDRKDLETKIQASQKQNLILEVGFEKAQSLMGVEFDGLVDEGIRNTFVDSKWNNILSQYTPEKDENGQTQWRDKDGKLIRNEANGMELARTKDLLMKELQPILKTGRQQAGAGTNGGTGGGGANYADFRAAKSKVEFDDISTNALLKQGLQRGTVQFAEQQAKMREENKQLFEALPLA